MNTKEEVHNMAVDVADTALAMTYAALAQGGPKPKDIGDGQLRGMTKVCIMYCSNLIIDEAKMVDDIDTVEAANRFHENALIKIRGLFQYMYMCAGGKEWGADNED